MRSTPRRQSQGDAIRAVSGDTLVPSNDDAQRQLVEDSIQVLNLDWNVDDVPGISSHANSRNVTTPKGNRSKRISIIDRASSAVSKSTSVLGKRGREAVGAGVNKLQGLTKRASLRPRVEEAAKVPACEEPAKKKTRLSQVTKAEPENEDSPAKKASMKPKVKRWLSQGLYVGQDPSFDPRYNTIQNKKKSSSNVSGFVKQQRKILPLPMFMGKTMLEQGRDFKLPWEIFNPLPPGQPKPEEWRKTRKSKPIRIIPIGLNILTLANRRFCRRGCGYLEDIKKPGVFSVYM